jgi:hypothetical protein
MEVVPESNLSNLVSPVNKKELRNSSLPDDL